MKKYPIFRWLIMLSCCFALSHLSAQIDKNQLLKDLEVLSSDEYAGRGTGKNEQARSYLIQQMGEINPAYSTLVDTFPFLDWRRKKWTGYNIVGQITGTKFPDQYIVLSAHYDHLGIRKDKIYNGADDNGSGTAALLALLHHFQKNPPQHSIIFAFFDAEELGLKGADRLVEDPPVARERILLNINMDMIGRNPDNTVNICGTYHFPMLNRPLNKVIRQRTLSVTKKHEGPNYKGADNWTMSSDHGMFLKRGIPYLYFGVEDHPGYHTPEDDFEYINQDFYYEVVNLVKTTTEHFDRKLNGKQKLKKKAKKVK